MQDDVKEEKQMDMTILMKNCFGVLEERTFCYGAKVRNVLDREMEWITDQVFQHMPVNHTLFKSFDKNKGIWTLEVYEAMRDFKSKPIWYATFSRIDDYDITQRFERDPEIEYNYEKPIPIV